MLNGIERNILLTLIEAKGVISGGVIGKKAGISLNTVRVEIDKLNQTLVPRGLTIESKTSAGYRLTAADTDEAAAYYAELKSAIRRQAYISGGYRPYLCYLMQKIICSDGGLSIELLSDEVFCSRSTLTRDLVKIRQFLKPYGLSISSRKSGGTYRLVTEGSEWNIRLFLLFLHKMYKLQVEDEALADDRFKSAFLISEGRDCYTLIRDRLTPALRDETHFKIPFVDIPKLVNFTILAATRRKYAGNMGFSAEQTERAEDTPEYYFAERFLKDTLSAVFGLSLKPEDVLGLSMMILSCETENTCLFDEEPGTRYSGYSEETYDFISYLSAATPLKREDFDQVFIRDYTTALYTLYNRRIFHMRYDDEVVGINRRKASLSYLLRFAHFYEARHGIRLDHEECRSMTYIFQRLLVKPKKRYYALSILILSRYGKPYADTLAKQLMMHRPEDIARIEAREFTDIKTDDILDFDIVISDISEERLRFIMTDLWIPVFPIQFKIGNREYPELDEILSMRRIREELSFIGEDSFIRTSFRTKDEVFKFIPKLFEATGLTDDELSKQAEASDCYVDLERDNKVVALPILVDIPALPEVYILLNDRGFVWNTHETRIIAVYLKVPDERESEIIGDILKRFIEIRPDQADALLNPASRPLSIIYPETYQS